MLIFWMQKKSDYYNESGIKNITIFKKKDMIRLRNQLIIWWFEIQWNNLFNVQNEFISNKTIDW